jgi:hypothetical protein
VEDLDGGLLTVVHEPPQAVGVLTAGGGYSTRLPWSGAAGTTGPELRDDGLVARRPESPSYDAPMFADYRWVAMLDPVELAEGREPGTGVQVTGGTAVESVTEVEHAGRPAWEAVVRVTSAYAPRCSCCPLLESAQAAALLAAGSSGTFTGDDREQYPEAHRVRLDVGTGVCVLTEELGGATSGAGHDLRIEAVDGPMDDELFPVARGRGRFRR